MSLRQDLMLIFFVLNCGLGYGQNEGRPVNISIFNESTAIPFTGLVNTPIHPGFQIGSEFEGATKNNWRFYPSVSIGFMFHKNLYQGVCVSADLGVDYQTSSGINVKSKVGVGYLHTFATRQEFQIRGTGYESSADRGNAHIMPSLTFGLGYNTDKGDPQSTEVYLLYQSWAEYPYSPGFIPLMTHTNLHLGAKLYPFKSE